jgi:tRNA(adenine34) deaminase
MAFIAVLLLLSLAMSYGFTSWSCVRVSSTLQSKIMGSKSDADNDESFMRLALRHAQHAFREKEVPIGAVIVEDCSGLVLASARNCVEGIQDPTAHAEINCIRTACEVRRNWRLSDCTLYTTLEPCPMCMGAINAARIKRVVYGATDERLGATGGGYLDMTATQHPFHSVQLEGGMLAEESVQLMQRFFRNRRQDSLDPLRSTKIPRDYYETDEDSID